MLLQSLSGQQAGPRALRLRRCVWLLLLLLLPQHLLLLPVNGSVHGSLTSVQGGHGLSQVSQGHHARGRGLIPHPSGRLMDLPLLLLVFLWKWRR